MIARAASRRAPRRRNSALQRKSVRAVGRNAGVFLTGVSLVVAAFGIHSAEAESGRKVEIIGHRGGLDFGPENTVYTVRHAWEVGADAVEIDVRWTSDGVPVIMHDETLDRTTNCTGRVAETTYAKLETCSAGGAQIPTFVQILGFLMEHPMHLYVDTKYTPVDQHFRQMLEELTSAGFNDGKKATVIGGGDVPARLAQLGARRVGLVFGSPEGWQAPFPVLIPYFTPITEALVADAHRRGKTVVGVEAYPIGLDQLVTGRPALDGFMADRLDLTLQQLNRYLKPNDSARTNEVRPSKRFVPKPNLTPDGT